MWRTNQRGKLLSKLRQPYQRRWCPVFKLTGATGSTIGTSGSATRHASATYVLTASCCRPANQRIGHRCAGHITGLLWPDRISSWPCVTKPDQCFARSSGRQRYGNRGYRNRCCDDTGWRLASDEPRLLVRPQPGLLRLLNRFEKSIPCVLLQGLLFY
jgi:hypothetical protein